MNKRINMLSNQRNVRMMLMLSLGLNALLMVCLWILEARVSKLESKHTDNSSLKVTIP